MPLNYLSSSHHETFNRPLILTLTPDTVPDPKLWPMYTHRHQYAYLYEYPTFSHPNADTHLALKP